MGASGRVFGSHYEGGLASAATFIGSLRVKHRFVKSVRLSRTPQRYMKPLPTSRTRLYHGRVRYSSLSTGFGYGPICARASNSTCPSSFRSVTTFTLRVHSPGLPAFRLTVSTCTGLLSLVLSFTL